MADWTIEHASAALEGVAEVFAEVGFRPDLVDDLRSARQLGGEVFVAVLDGDVVGVSSAVTFGATGWIGGVAVCPRMRRRGVGEELTRQAEQAVYERGARTALLHATPAARPLYAQMGFVAEREMVELHGPGGAPTQATVPLRPARADDLPAVLALDRDATGEDRRALYSHGWPGGALVAPGGDGGLRGFCLRQTPHSVGAVVALADDVGEALVRASLAGSRGPQRIGLPADRKALCAALAPLGFAPRSQTTRMRHGPPPTPASGQVYSVFNLYWG